MRYHWGLAVGHVYTHERPSTNLGFIWPGRNDILSTQSTQRQTDHDEQPLLTSHSQADICFSPRLDNDIDSAGKGGECEEEQDASESDLDDTGSNSSDDEELDENEELALDEMYGAT